MYLTVHLLTFLLSYAYGLSTCMQLTPIIQHIVQILIMVMFIVNVILWLLVRNLKATI